MSIFIDKDGEPLKFHIIPRKKSNKALYDIIKVILLFYNLKVRHCFNINIISQ